MNKLPHIKLDKPNAKIVVGLSGGVDSAVTALLLKEQGYAVSAIFMQNWETDNDDPHCTAEQDLNDARKITKQLDIDLQVVNFSKDYWHKVFQYCLDEFNAGRTPNPDIWCNKEIKFNTFLKHTLDIGADYLATGHYARIAKQDDKYELLKGLDNSKDQSYFLYTLGQFELAHSLFPLGGLEKTKVREIAKAHKLANYAKKDSTGICFIGERKFKDFLKEFLLAQPGEMQTPDGKTIGQHDGLMFYTIGQRQGLNIGGLKNAKDAPWYVLDKNIKENVLIVGQGSEHPLLFKSALICQQFDWVSGTAPKPPFNCRAKIRYRQQDQACKVTALNAKQLKIEFTEPQRAITPGQSIVFYQNDICLGGGIISE
ncbi:MAG: tRNA 2-thiouridine(34) synthase MnmA [Gammaproteobacteria bacterium]|nr:tRNA 2-thiouridine(34) synthase MnmA [Gammaproteobacteria bacterium]